MEVVARRAGAGDVDEVARLVRVALEAVAGQRGADQWLVTDAPGVPGPAELDDDAMPVWLVGCIDDVPVGVAAASERRWRDGRTVVRADLVYVEPGAREVGVGEALVDALLALAAGRGAVARSVGASGTLCPCSLLADGFIDDQSEFAGAATVGWDCITSIIMGG